MEHVTELIAVHYTDDPDYFWLGLIGFIETLVWGGRSQEDDISIDNGVAEW